MGNTFLAFIDGVDFNIFFRGLLSTLTMFVVLCGATYMIIATNVGVRKGMLVASAGFFGWMFLMGIIWTIYGAGWVGATPTWELVEINRGDLSVAETEESNALAGVDLSELVTEQDPDLAQAQALEISRTQDLSGWDFLPASNSTRGEAQSSVDEYLLETGAYGSTEEYVALQFGAFTTGGKPKLKDDPTAVDRFVHFFDETFANPLHKQELIMIQVQGAKDVFSFTGGTPPVAEIDSNKDVVSVIMERNRGGPIPSLISGLRFTPFMFTVVNGLIFLICSWALHKRDKREALALAGAAA